MQKQRVETKKFVFVIHGGTYKDFLKKLDKVDSAKITFEKTNSVHYKIVEIEAVNKTLIDFYHLPMLAVREEWSRYVFTKKIKSFKNLVKSLCQNVMNDDQNLFTLMMTVDERYDFVLRYIELSKNNPIGISFVEYKTPCTKVFELAKEGWFDLESSQKMFEVGRFASRWKIKRNQN